MTHCQSKETFSFSRKVLDRAMSIEMNRDNVQIMEKESAEQNGYYLTNSNVTHCLCIDFDIENELVSTDLNPSKDNLPYDSKNERYLPQYTTLDKLMKK